MNAERWLPVPDCPAYEVSDHGRVRSVPRVVVDMGGRRRRRLPGVMLKARVDESGHLEVALHGRNRGVHQLVMLAFVGPPPPGMQVCHGDGDPAHNALGNLRYGTQSDNAYDSLAHGTHYERGKDRCKHGHRLCAPNLRSDGAPGHRRCLACSRARSKVKNWRERYGVELDLRALADEYYREIMGGSTH